MNSWPSTRQRSYYRDALVACLTISLLVVLASSIIFARRSSGSIFDLPDYMGDTANSLLHGHGLRACTDVGGLHGNVICYQAARMPLVPVFVAALAVLTHDHLQAAYFPKALLLMLPIWGAMVVSLRGLRGTSRKTYVVASALLLLPFLVTCFVVDVENIFVEEGYTFSFLSLALAILLNKDAVRSRVWRACLLGASLALLYLSKSSMMLACVVMLVAFFFVEKRWLWRMTSVGCLLLAMLGWGSYAKATSGRFTLGTSLDMLNLHIGNNPVFLGIYPPANGLNLDAQQDYNPNLAAGHSFSNEWDFYDFHHRTALRWMKEHPKEVFLGMLKKVQVYFFTFRKFSSGNWTGVFKLADRIGTVAFRLLLWTSLALAIAGLCRSAQVPVRSHCLLFLSVVAACAAPHVIGFALTRHVSVLVYPCVLFLVSLLPSDKAQPTAAA